MEQKKEQLIQLIDGLNYGKDFVETIKDFINTYNGTNEDEFFALMYQMVIYVMYVQELEQKAKGFDELGESNENFVAAANKIKSDFEKISAGKSIEDPAQSSN
jgi:hypothetical protein